MDIVLVTGRFPQRSETFIYRKAVALAERGHRVTVAAREQGDWSLYGQPLPANVRVEYLPLDNSLRAPARAVAAAARGLQLVARAPGQARRLADRCRSDSRTQADVYRHVLRHLPFIGRRADVIHFEFLGLGAMYPLAGELANAPIVVSCRGQDVHMLELRADSERDAQLDVLRRADAIHCVSGELASEVTRLVGKRDAVWVNRAAVDTLAIRPRPAPAANGPVRLLASGRLVWIKGFDYLLAALARLHRNGVDFHMDIVGEGELRKPLEFSIQDLGLAGRVNLLGGVTPADVLARLQATDIFVLSSVGEGISNAALEAMASGVPVVTTNTGGMPEAISDGVEGFVVPMRDAPALAERIAQLAGDRELRARMGRAARARAEAEFSLERQASVFEQIYRSVAEAPR